MLKGNDPVFEEKFTPYGKWMDGSQDGNVQRVMIGVLWNLDFPARPRE